MPLPVVFAGPSIAGLLDPATDGVALRPPAGCGDLLRAVRDGAQVIGLIDGNFGDTAAVWHKEILAALDAGVAVLGAASMGALRAAECADFGMIGVGQIYEDYRNGTRVADADVAVLHAPAQLGYRPMTEALVDVEATLAAAIDGISTDEAERLLTAARRLHFRDRTWSALLAAACLPAGRAAAVETVLAGARVSQKQRDAAALLDRVRSGEVGRRGRPNTWTGPAAFNRTLFLAALEKRLDATPPQPRKAANEAE